MRQFLVFIVLVSLFFLTVWVTSGCGPSYHGAIKDEPALQYRDIDKHYYMLDGTVLKHKKRFWFITGGM